ncbi:MAG: Na+/H+ antiporter subunit G, partial [Gemmobacter sp.]
MTGLEWAAEAAIAVLLVLSGIFGIVGSYGLVKLPDTMTRLHAPTKATTLGVGGVLIASMLYLAVFAGHVSFHELMITLFLLLTAPITAHFIAKAQVHRAVPRADLPSPATDCEWATFDTAREGG